MKKYVYILGFIFAACGGQKGTDQPATNNANNTNKVQSGQYTIAFYNVENLFDTVDALDKEDDEFTPDSEKKWDEARYLKKLADISSVLYAIDSINLPAIVGFAEIENIDVLHQLAQQPKLQSANYQAVLEEGPDIRGIDVGLFYNPDIFDYLNHEKIPVEMATIPDYKTRDILYVTGVFAKADTLHIFVNHWSSRYGGVEESEPKRINAAKILKNEIAAIQAMDKDAKIIVMGDMNDEPQNKSLSAVLNATNNNKAYTGGLYNLMYNMDVQNKGTYNYRGNWNMLDNLIVSYSMLDAENAIFTTENSAQIFNADWIMYKNNTTGELSPNRTYGGNNYYGGYSDHLPVYFTLSVN